MAPMNLKSVFPWLEFAVTRSRYEEQKRRIAEMREFAEADVVAANGCNEVGRQSANPLVSRPGGTSSL